MNRGQIATFVRTERMKQGLSQEKLSEKAGVSKGRVEAVENQRGMDVGFLTISSIISALGFNLNIATPQK